MLLSRTLNTDLKWKEFTHLPYSPDLALNDYNLKNELGGNILVCGKTYSAGKFNIQTILGRNFTGLGFEKLVARYQKCLFENGDYVEK